MADKDEKKSESNKEDILRLARERFKSAQEHWAPIHKIGREDDAFAAGDQWPDEVIKDRKHEARPCLTVNRLPQFLRQVTNDQRQNSPSIKVSPVDDKADIETAKIREGLIRHIEYKSSAADAYDEGFDGAARRGFGFWKVTKDYAGPKTFLQDIKIKKITDHYSVFLDPSHRESDGSDSRYGFEFKQVPKDEFIKEFGEKYASFKDDWGSYVSSYADLFDEESVTVIEYYVLETKTETLFLLSDGQVFTHDELKEAFLSGQVSPEVEIVDERESEIPQLKWYKFAGDKVLDETDLPGDFIPLIPCYGEEHWVDGKRVLESVIRHAKDSQRMLNFWVSAETEAIALAPKAPWVGPAAAFEGYEPQWETANTKTHAYLPHNHIDDKGQPIPAPSRNAYEAPVQAITNARMQATEDLKATTGIYDAALGNRSNENSGIAIQRRANQAQISNYHFVDNLGRSIKHTGRIVNQWIPSTYDSARIQRIMGEDGTSEQIQINAPTEHNGKPAEYLMDVGEYDVTVETGPGYATKRQEAAASMMQFAQAMPQQASLFADLMARSFDWPGAQEIAERLKKTLPPGIVEDKGQAQIPPEIQNQMQQQAQMIEQMTAALTDANQKLSTKTMELESKERIEMAKIEGNLKLELFKANAVNSQIVLEQEVADLAARQAQLGGMEPFEEPFNPEAPDQGQGQMIQQPTGEMPGSYIGVNDGNQ